MTRKVLQQAYFLNRELIRLSNEKRALEEAAVLKAQSYSGIPHSGGVGNPTESIGIKLMEMEKELDAYEQNIRMLLRQIMEYVNDLMQTDAYMGIIVKMRCTEMRSWSDIAKALGDGYSPDAVRRYFQRKIPWE